MVSKPKAPPKITARQMALNEARSIFVTPPTDEPAQAEAVVLLRGRYKLPYAEIGSILQLRPREVNTRKRQYQQFATEKLIPTGRVPLFEVSEDPHEGSVLDELERRKRLKATAEGKQEIIQDIFLDRLVAAVAPLLPTKHDLKWVEQMHKLSRVAPTKKKPEETAMGTMSDLHLCLVNAQHNFERGLLANSNFNKKVVRLTELHRQTFTVKRLVINSLGDQVQGTANFPDQRWSVDRPAVDQCEAFVAMMVGNIEFWLTEFDEVEVIVSRGNHGYLTGKKISTDPAHSNWETIAGRALKWAFRDSKRVKITVPLEWYYVNDVNGVKVLTTHGHEMAGSGDYATMVRQINGWHSVTQDYDYVIMGHWHRCFSVPLPTRAGAPIQRALYGNGTAADIDSYLQKMGSSPTPQWWLFFLDRKGITTEYKVALYGRG